MTGTNRRRFGFSLVGLAGTSCVLIASCSPPTNSVQGPRAGGSITVATQEQDSLLACNITSTEAHACAYVNPVMEGLLTVKASQDVPQHDTKLSDYWVPELATEVPTLENGDVRVNNNKMDVTWKLRPGVKWQDGAAFSSADVKATFDFWWLKYRNLNPTPLVTTSGWDQVASVETPNSNTAIVHFKAVFAPYLTLGTGPYGILPNHILQQIWSQTGDITHDKVSVNIPGGFKGTDTLDKLMVGTGPFMFKEWVPHDHITLVRNPHWWGSHQAYLDQIKIKFEADANQELDDLSGGNIDMGLDMRASLLPRLSRLSDVGTAVIVGSSAEHIDINLHNTFLQDPILRKAILLGIDRQRIVDTLLLGKTNVPPDAWMCVGTGSWCLDPNARRTQYNPDAARTLLDSAGYKVQDSGPCKGYRTDSHGRCVQIHLATSTLPLREQEGIDITADLALIGIQVIKPFNEAPTNRLFGPCTSGGILYSHNFDLALYTNYYSYPAEPDSWVRTRPGSRMPDWTRTWIKPAFL
ncbi:MAG: hypothetical protein E6H92_10105 [Chloroflexi bacterium]|nr:MAG: hypothetical protein E6H92_10105 [Chloroflexota bacterium]